MKRLTSFSVAALSVCAILAPTAGATFRDTGHPSVPVVKPVCTSTSTTTGRGRNAVTTTTTTCVTAATATAPATTTVTTTVS
jgi:hypothetical protein